MDITTEIIGSSVVQKIKSAENVIFTQCIKTLDDQFREALITLGWTPPALRCAPPPMSIDMLAGVEGGGGLIPCPHQDSETWKCKWDLKKPEGSCPSKVRFSHRPVIRGRSSIRCLIEVPGSAVECDQ